ncbi:MAG: hypothetical protein N2444_05900, partial [Methylocystis sp.]|nr:hypothetical protein [Methylocystis sp.]
LYQRDGGHLPDSKLALWRDLIKMRNQRCAEMGIAYAHLVVPEKLTIYGEKQTEPLVDAALAPAVRLEEMFGGASRETGYIDLVGPMFARKNEVPLYWRTDTHWTAEGCGLAYELLCEHFRLPENPELPQRPFRNFGKIMDLGGKLRPPVWETIQEVHWLRDATRVYENRVLRILEAPEFGGLIHVGAVARFENPAAASAKRILLFGDSFSDASPYMLTAMLAETVREVEFVWSANIDWSLVERRKPDILITQIAERYMALPPHDNFNLWRMEKMQVLRARRQQLDHWLRSKLSAARRRADGGE